MPQDGVSLDQVCPDSELHVQLFPECVVHVFVSWVRSGFDVLCSGLGLGLCWPGASMVHYGGFRQIRERAFLQSTAALCQGGAQAW